jgi:hypothetical protein
MKTLLWKEWRESRTKIAIAFSLIILIHVLSIEEGFEVGLVQGLFRGLYPVFGGIVSILLAMDLVTSERTNGTLNFTLSRPVSPLQFLAAKFLVGSIALLLLHALFWLTVYGFHDALAAAKTDQRSALAAAQLIRSVSLPRMIVVSFPMFWLAFTITFAWSAISIRSDVASMGGLMSFIAVGILIAAVGGTSTILEQWGMQGHVFRIATTDSLLWTRIVVLALLVVLLLGATVWYLQNARERTVGWKLVLTFAVILIGGSYLRSRVDVARDWNGPETVVEMEIALRDLEISEDVAYLVIKDGLATLDISDVGSPRQLGASKVEGWTTYNAVISGDRAHVFAHENDEVKNDWDDIGILEFDISNPAQPMLVSETRGLVSGDEIQWRGAPVADGNTAYFALVTHDAIEVVVIDLSGQAPSIADRVTITRELDEVGINSVPNETKIAFHNDAIYVATTDVITVLDRSDHLHPTVANQIPLNDAREMIYSPRRIDASDDRLYVTHRFPMEIRIYDISNPITPTEVGFELTTRGVQKLSVAEGYLFGQMRRDRLRTYRIDDAGNLTKESEIRVGWETWERQGGPIHVKDGHLIALMGTRVVVHPLKNGGTNAIGS